MQRRTIRDSQHAARLNRLKLVRVRLGELTVYPVVLGLVGLLVCNDASSRVVTIDFEELTWGDHVTTQYSPDVEFTFHPPTVKTGAPSSSNAICPERFLDPPLQDCGGSFQMYFSDYATDIGFTVLSDDWNIPPYPRKTEIEPTHTFWVLVDRIDDGIGRFDAIGLGHSDGDPNTADIISSSDLDWIGMYGPDRGLTADISGGFVIAAFGSHWGPYPGPRPYGPLDYVYFKQDPAGLRFDDITFTLPDDGGGTQPSTPPEIPDLPLNIPEPATIVLLGLGLAGLGFARRRRNA